MRQSTLQRGDFCHCKSASTACNGQISPFPTKPGGHGALGPDIVTWEIAHPHVDVIREAASGAETKIQVWKPSSGSLP